jgi:hypothetical protein
MQSMRVLAGYDRIRVDEGIDRAAGVFERTVTPRPDRWEDRLPMPPALRLLCFAPLLLTACAIEDSRTAHVAQTEMVGMSQVDLESCLGVPDQHATFGDVDVLTYYTASSSSMTYSIPVIGGLGFSNGGNCHATFDLKDGHVVRVLYSGEKNAFAATDAYCAPILNTCLGTLDRKQTAARTAP